MAFQGGSSPIEDEERLARFVLHRKWVRKSDGAVKQDAFIPYPYPDLSVNRHDGNRENEVWLAGEGVAAETEKKLHGRADVVAQDVRDLQLTCHAAPLPQNPNHANIQGWPREKNEQKSYAQELAARSVYFARRAV